jgi:hypothetical protein
MNLIEINRALRQLGLGGIAAVLETRLHQAQAEPMAPIDFLSCLVSPIHCRYLSKNDGLQWVGSKLARSLLAVDSAAKSHSRG